MTLAEVFSAGHRVAVSKGARRTVVLAANPPAPEGWWLVREDALPAVVYKKAVGPGDLAGSLGAVDMTANHWDADDEYCWCQNCSNSRRMFETQGD